MNLGMVVILGIFYFGQDERLKDENAVVAAVDNTVDWIQKNNFQNVIIEVANESNNQAYKHAVIKQDRIHELIQRIKKKLLSFWFLQVLMETLFHLIK